MPPGCWASGGMRRTGPTAANPGAADSAATPAAGKPSPNEPVASASPTEAPEAAPANPGSRVQAGRPGRGAEGPGTRWRAPSPDATPAAPDRYTIDGRDYAADDLRKAIAEYGDYTKKTQALAAEQKRVNDQAQQLRALHEQHQAFATVLPLLQPELNRLAQSFQMAPRPDPALAESDPHGYLKQLAAHDASRSELERLQQIMGVQTGAQSRQLAEATEKGNQYLSERYPVWRDPAQRAELQKTIVEWAESKGGFTRDELKSVVDPRHIEALMKAAMYDRLSEGAKTRPRCRWRRPMVQRQHRRHARRSGWPRPTSAPSPAGAPGPHCCRREGSKGGDELARHPLSAAPLPIPPRQPRRLLHARQLPPKDHNPHIPDRLLADAVELQPRAGGLAHPDAAAHDRRTGGNAADQAD